MEIINTTWIILDVAVGAFFGVWREEIQKAMLLASAVGFFFAIITFVGNPNSLTQLTIPEANERIIAIVTFTVTFIVNLLFAEIGAIPANLIAQFFKNR